MASVVRPRLGVWRLLGGTFAELAAIPGPLALYFLFFAVMAFFSAWSAALMGLVAIISLPGYFIGQYLLYRAALDHGGRLAPDATFRVFRFAGMALLLAVPISIGFNVFVLPGLFFAAKWIMAPAYLVAGQRNIFESIGASWTVSDGNTVQIAVALALLVFLWTLVLIGGVVVAEDLFPSDAARTAVTLGFLVHLLPVMLLGLSVSAFKSLNRENEWLDTVFG